MTLSERDKKHNWHPYTQHKTALDFPAIVKGKKALLWDENNKEYIDAIASWWVNPYGHSNAFMAKAIYRQLTTLEHVLFGGFTHNKAVELSEKLIEILPSNQQKFFYSDNGSTAVEVAIKVALQYFHNKGQKRTKIIAFEDAFHGDTFAAMATSGISLFTEAFQGSLLEVSRIPVPVKGKEQESIDQLEKLVKTKEYAAFIFEPLVQGAAGMIMYSPEILDQLIKICKDHTVFTIADEVMTGFRLAKGGVQELFNIKADIVCFGKVIGGGLPVGAFAARKEIMNYLAPIGPVYQAGTLSGNPLAMAAGLAMLTALNNDASIFNRLEEKTSYLEKGIHTVLTKNQINFTINRVGSMISVHFDSNPVVDFETAKRGDNVMFKNFFHGLLKEGIYIAPSAYETWFITDALTFEDLDYTIQAIDKVSKSL